MTRRYCQHGMTGTKIHEVWKEMKRRCKHGAKNSSSYIKNKITVCDEWQDSEPFILWALGNGYRDGLQLDRIKNTDNYSPTNCRFVTPKENSNNKANTIFLTYKNKTLPIQIWAEKLNVNGHTLYTRYKRGWSVKEILTKKIQRRGNEI